MRRHFCSAYEEKQQQPDDRLKTKICSRKLAFHSNSSAANFNACRQVAGFSDIRSKVGDISHPSFPEGASSQRYPTVFCAHPVSTVTDNFKFSTKREGNTFSTMSISFPAVLFESFRTVVQDTAPCQSIKFYLLFFLFEFVSGKARPWSPGMMMESRKAAPGT